jgi:hypothetical protein
MKRWLLLGDVFDSLSVLSVFVFGKSQLRRERTASTLNWCDSIDIFGD